MDDVAVIVEDAGPGIPESIRDEMFAPFVRAGDELPWRPAEDEDDLDDATLVVTRSHAHPSERDTVQLPFSPRIG